MEEAGYSSPQPPSGAPCAGHSGNPATGVCERCGDFMCGLCTTHVEGRSYCPKCFDLLYARGSLGFTQRQFTLPGLALGLGIAGLAMSLLCFCVVNVLASIPLGAAGLGMALRGLKEHRERPDLPNRGMTVTGLVFSILALLLSAGEIVFWLYTFLRRL